jgi:dTDP-4-amino-4,6-dideoxygalactose transaminase
MHTTEDLEVIPLVDLHAQHREVGDEVKAGIDAVLDTGAFVGGAEVIRFEADFAAFTGAGHCVGVGNGTDAIELALRAAQLPEGSTVVLPANTFIATAEAAVRAGHPVRLVDCDPVHALIDVEATKRATDPEVSAVIAVDLYGQVAPFEQLGELGVALVEDAAQSQGATRFGQGAGSFGVAAGTSFYPGKNLGAYGDAGAVLTDDAALAGRVRALRNHGGVRKYEHEMIGVNSRLDTVQAVVLNAKLRRLAGWNAERRAAADRYASLLEGVDGVRTPEVLDGNEHVWHLYVIEVAQERRDRVVAALNAAGVGAGIHYPTPLHLTPAFAHLGYGPGDFPVAERLAGRILSLPIFPGITERQQERVVAELRLALDR